MYRTSLFPFTAIGEVSISTIIGACSLLDLIVMGSLWLRQSWAFRAGLSILALDYVVDELSAEDEQSPEYALMRREEYADLLAALERLPAIQQQALRLRFVNELPCAEVAKALGKREGAVKCSCYYIRSAF